MPKLETLKLNTGALPGFSLVVSGNETHLNSTDLFYVPVSTHLLWS